MSQCVNPRSRHDTEEKQSRPQNGTCHSHPEGTPGTKAQGNAFLSGVAVLTISTVLVKVVGLLYKIPMLHVLGSEGMGYFNAAYEWYALFCTVATAGLPIAGSMLIARARAKWDFAMVERVERVMLRLFLGLGFGGSLLMYAGAGVFAGAIGSPDTAFALRAVAPTLLFSCLSGAYRGYFQGFENMTPTALSQVIEALGKLLLGLGFAAFAWRRGMTAPHIAAWAMLGLSLGVAISVIYLMIRRATFRPADPAGMPLVDGEDEETVRPLRQLLGVAVPLTIGSAILCLTKVVDMAMILRRLQDIGYDTAGANALYGGYTTMAVPIFNLVPSLVTSVALALVPALTAAIKRGDRASQRSTAQTAFRLTVLLSLPAAAAVAIYSRAILHILFRGDRPAADVAAPLLSLLAVSIFFSSVITTTNAILQAYGRVHVPIVSMLVGSLVKLLGAYVLIGIPRVNIAGAPISTFLCDACIVGINLFMIERTTDVMPPLRSALLRPLGVSLAAVGIPGIAYALLVGRGYSEILLFAVAVPVTVGLFLLLCLRTRLIGRADLALLPGTGGERVLRLWGRLKRT